MKNKEIEQRALTTNFEIRSNEDGQEYFEGYALKFEQWSEVMGDFQEIIDKDALKNTDLSDVRALINHDNNYILARTSADNLELEVDGIGLKFKAYPSDTSYSRDLKENMRAGNLSKCSFAFRLNWDNPDCEKWEYNEESKLYQRRIKDIAKIVDVSIVTNPSYQQTEAVITRALDDFKEKQRKELLKRKLQLELELL
ncbi:phage prohead protease, HK97 family [Desulfitobacterium hafniense DCB-2]|uniref:Phage prohead protease, HK97 family n=1 Tax=Desulfitobacterium hafniense (strain DSM 10664 / DCB-2) TaxID=272564 RepID=B8FNY6_DESHD|nr:HK97 family phage prohead protease [Desulfitobacterium hafniense]ACL19511.1 phage prohead protease, HK97 family [Desulfitobacterium hafniense DCB-2]